MKALIQGKETNLKVTSLILESDPLNPDMMSIFHCLICGQKGFQYSASIIMVIPGGTKVNVPIIHQCDRCKHRYLINSLM